MTSAGPAGPGATRDALLAELRALLEEPMDAARGRERTLRAVLEAQPEMPIVLFGAGNLGRRTLSLLRAHGRPPAAFIDNASGLWGTVVDGVPVLSPADASARYAADGLVVVTIWRAEGGHDFGVTRENLRNLGWRRVESFIPLFWGYGVEALPYITIDLPTKVLEAREDVLSAAALWLEERSLREYVAQVRWRLTADFAVLSPTEPNQYFADSLVRVGPNEVFVDCGAFTGDTLLDFAGRVPSWRAYHAFEPDPTSFAALQAVVAALPGPLADRVHLHRAATSDRRSTARFNATGQGSAQLSAQGAYDVECVAIDDVVTGPAPTFVKMDIEGAEAAALAGTRRAIVDGRPLLAVAAYHKQADLWELPRLVHEMAADYQMFLRPHAGEGFDTVLYAVPPERLVGA
jgi:FkbM family methyltransferase